MPRDLPIGNGNMLIAFDHNSLLREFYFPHVGEENHTKGEPFRFGIFVDGQFEWVPNRCHIEKNYLNDSLVTDVKIRHDPFQLSLQIHDLVDFHQNFYLKKMIITNHSDREREVRLFFGQDFHIYCNEIGDTAAFRPEANALVHYKEERYFLINIFANQKYGIDHYAIGNKGSASFEGTWKDAEDGILSQNPIAQGSVDSVTAIHLKIKPGQSETCYYYICSGQNFGEVLSLDETMRKKSPEAILKRTLDYWNLWVNKDPITSTSLPPNLINLYKRSLLICRTQINNCGSIIAANDSDAIYFNRDTYSYMWPRDGALVAHALDLARYELTQNFYTFCGKIIENDGYFLHKYTPNGSLASSWHPWIKDHKAQLPIQEDETALVIWALWHHFQIFKDVEFIASLYRPLIKRAANFMMNYRDNNTGLPLPSYDLWEERQGVLTFTACAVYGGLIAAAGFTDAFGEHELAEEYRQGAEEMKKAISRYLYLEKEKRFARMIVFHPDGSYDVDSSIDASLYGCFAFGAFSARDEKVRNTMEQISEKLWCKTPIGGIARYENDSYQRATQNTPGNPWFLTTLWLAEYYIAAASNKQELEKGLSILKWVGERALPSGVLAEQIHPNTGAYLSISPLTWAHAEYITAFRHYLQKEKELS